MRGYENNSLSPSNGATIYNKYTLELRYALSLNPQSPIFALAFLEAGNTWNMTNKFNPFDIKRSAGVGIRMTIPMMGIMGVDWGYGFDEIQVAQHQVVVNSIFQLINNFNTLALMKKLILISLIYLNSKVYMLKNLPMLIQIISLNVCPNTVLLRINWINYH